MRIPLWRIASSGEAVPRKRLSAVVTLVLIVMLGIATSACGAQSTEADQPGATDGVFVTGDFAVLPKPAGAVPVTGPTVDGRTTTQSFKVVGSTVEGVVAFYQTALPEAGWKPDSAPAEVGEGDWQAAWARGDQVLQVSASPYDPDDPVTSQLDLILTR